MEIELAALILSAAAFVLSGWAAWNSHRQTEASKRQADAAEDQLALMREQQDALDARPLHLTHFNGGVYQLTNIGSLTAYDVSVEGGARIQWRTAPEDSKLGPGESATLAVMLQSKSRRMTMRWATEPGGETKEMTQLLPSRPPNSPTSSRVTTG
ncbi:MAG: hypothetical protein M3306_17170 [Actinomycetota bacterium]|nr:hypothetical protein [Actinomycetota bacterium]